MSRAAGRSRPVLVAAAHGTRDPRGRAVVRRLCERVRAARPDLDVRTAWVDFGVPSLAEVLAQVTTPSVVVPLLLSTGYHVRVDLPRAAAAAGGPTTIAPPLGPDPALARLVARRLVQAGARRSVQGGAPPWDAVVLAAAGSSDPRAADEVAGVAEHVSRVLGVPVRAAFASAAAPDVATAVTDARAAGHRAVAVARYLLAPGFFADTVAATALAAGARWVTECLGDDPALAALVVRRFDAAAAA